MASMALKITKDGQVTLPTPVLEHLGVGPGGTIDLQPAPDGRVVIEKTEVKPLPPERFSELLGHAGPGLTTDEIMEMTRGE